jgi:dATP pyrophosphohydrolase
MGRAQAAFLRGVHRRRAALAELYKSSALMRQAAGFGAGRGAYRAREVLLLERAARPGFWQSVTGSLERPTSRSPARRRELREETGIEARAGRPAALAARLYLRDLRAVAPPLRAGNHAQYGACLQRGAAATVPVALAPQEHVASLWLPGGRPPRKCFSWSNRDAIRI